MNRPQIQLRFRDKAQHERLVEAARVAGISLNEYLLRKIEGTKVDMSKRNIK